MRRLFLLKKDGDSGLLAGTIATGIWVRGPQLPDDVEDDGLLTAEDHRDLTLDHIARTSELVARIEILKWA
jgi:hypothetical protein